MTFRIGPAVRSNSSFHGVLDMTNNQPMNSPASTSAPPSRFGQTGKMRRFVFGDDVFISYSRRRGAEYALALANVLTRHKLSCFLDQWGTPPDQDLPDQL